MRAAFLLAGAAALVAAVDNDPNLDIDWDLVLNLDPVPDPEIPVVYKTDTGAPASTSEKITYSATSAVAAVASAVVDTLENALSDPIVLIPSLSQKKRDVAATTCVPQPSGLGPVPTNDTPEDFLKDARFAAAATAADAVAPAGYVSTFTNLQASNNAYGYMGYTLLPSYNVTACAAKCTAINGCQSFNLYFERNPTVDPNAPSCLNPRSTTNIKCVFWGGPVAASNAVNTGQWRGQFRVVIAGSNGYVNRTISTPVGYQMPQFYGTVAINAPAACPGKPSRLLQSNAFVARAFDIALCATACSEQKAWARTQPNMRQCNYFDTYLLYKNSKPLAQYCAMYDEMWTGTYATNNGYTNGADKFTIGFSYSSWNVTDTRQGEAKCAAVTTTTTSRTTTTTTSRTTTAVVTTTAAAVAQPGPEVERGQSAGGN